MRFFKPLYKNQNGQKKRTIKFYLDFVDHASRRRRMPAFESQTKTEILSKKIKELIFFVYQSEPLDGLLLRWFFSQPQRIQRKLENWGLLPKQESFDDISLVKNVADYQTSLRAGGKSETHIQGTVNRIRAIINFCGWKTIKDIEAFRVDRYLQNLRTANRSATTINHYQAALRAFCGWLKRYGRMQNNPVDFMNKLKTHPAQRGILTAEQFRTLIEKTVDNKQEFYEIRRKKLKFQLSGPSRATLYLVAGLTGFRRGELLSMRWSDVILNENNPAILLDGSRTKNHRNAVQPIPNGLCRMLFCWKQTLNPGSDEPLFHNFTEHGRPSEWIREDLKAANLPTKDYEGRKIDFHSLRGSYITFLANSQTPVRVTQELARHSNPALTMNVYAKVLPEIQKQAVRSLPDINPLLLY